MGVNPVPKLQDLHANFVVAGPGFTDEGRGPYFRQLDFVGSKTNPRQSGFQDIQGAGMHYTSWITENGYTVTYIAAVDALPDRTFAQDPLIGAAQMLADVWTWDGYGPGVNAKANTVVWIGMDSFVNSQSWLGPYALSNPAYGLTPPTYPDGRSALGYKNGDSSDPRNAFLYDAMAAKAIDGSIPVYAGDPPHALPTPPNLSGLVAVPIGEFISPPTPCLSLPGAPPGTCAAGSVDFPKDTAATFWRDYTNIAIRFTIQNGGDGYWMDNCSGWNGFSNHPTSAAFGEWSVAKFRDYLVQKQIPVPGNPTRFDVRSYLKGLLSTWSPGANVNNPEDPGWRDIRFLSDPIWRAYVAFKGQISHDTMVTNFQGMKDAATRMGKDPDQVYLGGNDIPGLTFGALDGNEMEQVNSEYDPFYGTDVDGFGRGLPPFGHNGSFYSIAASLENSQHAIVWFYLKPGEAPQYVGLPNLGEVIGFEALANNTILNVDPDSGVSPGNADSIRFVNSTIERLSPVLGYRARKGRVGLVFGSFTQVTGLTPGGYVGEGNPVSSPSSFSHLDHSVGFAGWAEALEERHTPYRVIPDYKLASGGIPSDVSVLIFPHITAIEPETVQNVLVPFVQEGGTLLISGAASGSQKTRKSSYASNASSLLADLTRRTDLGSGRAIFVSGNPGFDFHMGLYQTRTGAPNGPATKAAAQAAIESVLQPLEASGALPAELGGLSWGDRVWVTEYAGETGQYYLDFLNTDINLSSDTITASSGGQLIYALPPGLAGAQSVRAEFFDADGPGAQDVAATLVDPGHVALSIPAFRVYGTLVLSNSSSEGPSSPVLGAMSVQCNGLACTALFQVQGATSCLYAGNPIPGTGTTFSTSFAFGAWNPYPGFLGSQVLDCTGPGGSARGTYVANCSPGSQGPGNCVFEGPYPLSGGRPAPTLRTMTLACDPSSCRAIAQIDGASTCYYLGTPEVHGVPALSGGAIFDMAGNSSTMIGPSGFSGSNTLLCLGPGGATSGTYSASCPANQPITSCQISGPR